MKKIICFALAGVAVFGISLWAAQKCDIKIIANQILSYYFDGSTGYKFSSDPNGFTYNSVFTKSVKNAMTFSGKAVFGFESRAGKKYDFDLDLSGPGQFLDLTAPGGKADYRLSSLNVKNNNPATVANIQSASYGYQEVYGNQANVSTLYFVVKLDNKSYQFSVNLKANKSDINCAPVPKPTSSPFN